jgi:polyhydroxyalkanoate synthesis regulator phasin
MNARRLAIIVTTGALAAGGAGVAVGATSNDKAKKAEDNILADAAKQLGTTPEKLRDALGSAEDAQLDQAVKDGDLTQAQADAIKKRRQASGRVLGIPGFRGPGGPGGPGVLRGPGGPGGPERHGRPGFGRGPGGGLFGDAAKALGISESKLFSELRTGKSLAEIAKANGKTVDDVKAAVKAAAKARLDKAVKAGDLTQSQADEMLAHLDEHLADFGERGLRFRGGHRRPAPAPAPAP